MTNTKAAEKALIETACTILAPDFIVRTEVLGRHWTGTEVKIDLAIYPLPHTIARGFPKVWMGVEAKMIYSSCQQYLAKYNSVLAQCNSYMQSRWQLPTYEDEVSLACIFVLLPPENTGAVSRFQKLAVLEKQRTLNALMETMQSFNIGKLQLENNEYRFFFGTIAYADHKSVISEINTGLIPRIGSRSTTTQRHERDLALMARLHTPVKRKRKHMTTPNVEMEKVIAAFTAEYTDREDLREAIIAHIVQIHYPHLVDEIRSATDLAMQTEAINTAQLTNVAKGVLLIAYEGSLLLQHSYALRVIHAATNTPAGELQV